MASETPEVALESTAAASESDRPATPRPRLAIGSKLGRYEIMGVLGAGAMGVVYRARDPELAREVAVKDLVGFADTEMARARLRREAQAMARIDHRAVVRIYDVGVDGDHLFVAMELVEGGTLLAWLKERDRPPRAVVRVFVEAARGLAAAHDAGVVHRDIKPQNILVDRAGNPHVGDFGLARGLSDEPETEPRPRRDALAMDLTATGGLLGTPAYMAPEQLDGEPVTSAADQFSLAVSAWEALAGERPFAVQGEGLAVLSSLRESIARGPTRVTSRRFPKRIRAVLQRALAENPKRRYPSTTALADALEASLARRELRWGAAAMVVLALVVAGYTTWHRHSGPAESGSPHLQVDAKRTLATTSTYEGRVLLSGDRVATASRSNISITDLAGNTLATLPPPESAKTFEIRAHSDPNTFIAVTGDPSAGCRIWRMSPDPSVAPVRIAEDVNRCDDTKMPSPDGTSFAAALPTQVEVRAFPGGERRWARAEPGFNHEVQWSPDGKKLAAGDDGDTTIVLDASTGERLARADGGISLAWLDRDHLLHLQQLGSGLRKLRMLELGPTPKDEVVFTTNAFPSLISTNETGALMSSSVNETRVRVAPLADVPIDFDRVEPVRSGRAQDRLEIGWTKTRQLLLWSVQGEHTELVRLGSDGSQITTLKTATEHVTMVTASPESVLWILVPPGGGCVASVVDTTTGSERALDVPQLCLARLISCQRDLPRCLVLPTRGSPVWVETSSGTVTSAPAFLEDALAVAGNVSPDGSDVAFASDDGRVVLRSVVDGSDHVVLLQPALDPGEQPVQVTFAAGSDHLLVATSNQTGSAFRLLDTARDGHWRELGKSSSGFTAFHISPDLRSIAVSTFTTKWNHEYYPVVRAH